MAVDVTMPKFGLTMTEGLIARWLAADGASVASGMPLFEVQTDKANVQVEAPSDGTLHIIAQEGTSVPVGQTVARILTPGDAPAAAEPPASPVATSRPSPQVDLSANSKSQRDSSALPSPAARRRARELGIDIATVIGSGDGGRITEKDVEAVVLSRRVPASPGPAPAPPPQAVIPISGVRAVIAQRMQQSASQTARVTLMTELDATEFVALRRELNEALQEKLNLAVSFTDLLVKIVAQALHEFPYMNATQVGDEIHWLTQIHLGIAVDTPRGLLVPVVRDADQKSIAQIAREAQSLIQRAQEGTCLPGELSGGTFTITNLGMYGVDAFTPVINPPELAILGVGRIMRKPAELEGQVALREQMTLSLAFDHRLVDGAPAARFLQRVAALVQKPYLLLTN